MAYMKAKCAYTYGWTDEVMSCMKYHIFMDYWIAITAIESEMQLLSIEASCSSIMERKSREKVISKYRRKTGSLIEKNGGKLATVQDVANAFAKAKMRANG